MKDRNANSVDFFDIICYNGMSKNILSKEKTMKLTINKSLHSRYALLKAAYHFTDEFYILLDQDETSYYIDISSKEGDLPDDIEGIFSNELLAQSTREAILEKTSSLRELILARAFASTIIDDKTTNEVTDNDSNDDNGEIDKSLFKDWYEG